MEVEKLYDIFRTCSGVSTDTRNLEPGSLFFALRGKRFNGNHYANEALEKGAAYAVVDEPPAQLTDHHLVVDDALVALQKLALYHREQLCIPVLALTGSNGKTTSKELIRDVLSRKYRVYATPGNLNNHIGVPLTLLRIQPDVEIAVVEMGANRVGDIAGLCRMALPTHGLITNIGKAHIGTFGGFENIIRGKTELYEHLIQHDGIVFINSQNDILMRMAYRFKNPVLYPAKGDYFHCELIAADPFVRIRTETGRVVETQLPGSYNFENLAVALCIGKFFGVEEADAADAVARYVPSSMRSQIIRKGTNTIFLDAYNANPTSMRAAIDTLVEFPATRKVLILGDMFELEEEAEKEHREIGKLITERGFTEVYLCGNLMQAAASACSSARYYADKEALAEAIRRDNITGAAVLIKGSRGMALETIVDYL